MCGKIQIEIKARNFSTLFHFRGGYKLRAVGEIELSHDICLQDQL